MGLHQLTIAALGGLVSLLSVAPVFLALTLAEVLLPCHGAKPSWRSRGQSALFWLVGAPLGAIAATLATVPVRLLHIHPLLATWTVPYLPPIAGVILGGILAAALGDLAYYWVHRAQHRFFWRFHAIHHSVREMSGLSSYHHFSEGAFMAVLYGVPVSLIAPDPHAVPIVAGLVIAIGHYLHSPTMANFGPLHRVIADNRFHRIHHSLEPKHWDKNFCAVTPIWDALFGTAWWPRADEWPDTGLPEDGELTGVGDYLLRPFVLRRQRRRRATLSTSGT